jgi:predicted transcriptional regulator
MAKVMVSLPDDLLAEVDARAEQTGTSRSAVLRSFVEEGFRRRSEQRAAAVREIMRRADFGGSFGGENVKALKEGRPTWPKR